MSEGQTRTIDDQMEWGGLLPEYRLLFEHDAASANHSIRVARYALHIGIQQKLTRAELETLYFGGQLHDVGKTDVPHSLLNKNGALTDSERAVMDRHARVGERILRARYGPTIASIARDHHAVHHGISTDPLTRIVAVCDEWDALRSDRPYKDGMSIDETVGMLKERYADDEERFGILRILIGAGNGLDGATHAQRKILERTLS